MSDSLFARGVELYNAGLFKDALSCFERTDSLDRLQMDPTDLRLDYAKSWMASCLYKLGDEPGARNHEPYFYRFQPIDRRLTVTQDSVNALFNEKMLAGDYQAAFIEVSKLSELEHAAFEPNHYVHIMTTRFLWLCESMLQRFDDAEAHMEESVRLIRHNFGEKDTLQLEEIFNLVQINLQKPDFAKVQSCLDLAREITAVNLGDKHSNNAVIEYWNIALALTRRDWDEASERLYGALEVCLNCFADNPQLHNEWISNFRQMYRQSGRMEDCAIIDKFATMVATRQDNKTLFDTRLSKLSNEIALRQFSEAWASIAELEAMLPEMDAGDSGEKKAVLECMRCTILMAENRLEEAKDAWLAMLERGDEEALAGTEMAPLFSTVKMFMSMALSDFERAAEAIDKIVESLPDERLPQNINVVATQAAVHSIAGNFDKAREAAKRCAELYDTHVIKPRAMYRLEKDTTELNAAIRTVHAYLTYGGSIAADAAYSIRDIKSQLILIQSRMLENLDRYGILYDYYDCVSDYAFELVRMDKYPEAQEVMDRWVTDWKKAYDAVDWSKEDEMFRYEALLTLDAGLEFRAKRCYEDGDPLGTKAFEEYLEFIKEAVDGDTDDEFYRRTKIKYFEFKNDNKGLIDYVSGFIDKNPDKQPLGFFASLSSAFEKENDFEHANLYHRKYIIRAMADKKSTAENEDLIYSSLTSLTSNYSKELRDTAKIFEFYENEFWPRLAKTAGDNHARFFIRSVDILRFDVNDGSFIPYVERALAASKKLLQNPLEKAALYQTIAGVLRINPKQDDLAFKYITEARELAKDDTELNLLLGCYQHDILSRGGYIKGSSADDAISLGSMLIPQMKARADFADTNEYLAFIYRQMRLLNAAGRYNEAVDLGEAFFASEPLATRPFLPPNHPVCELISMSYNSQVQYSSSNAIREEVFVAQSAVNKDVASDYALKVVENEVKDLRQMLNIVISGWRSDDMISKSSKYADIYRTDSLKCYAYDVSLLCKGLEMRSNNTIRAIIKNSDHKGALRKFDELQYVMNRLSAAKGSELDSLAERKKSLERDLHRLSRHFGDFTQELNISWRDISTVMKPEDLAVELTFVRKDYSNEPHADNLRYGYYACLLRKDMKAPEIVYIAPDDSITSDLDIYSDPRLSRLLLSPLKPYLEGVRNIYLSPIGKFNRISVESLPLPDSPDETLSSRYNVYRLSSTRELIGSRLETDGTEAVIYGGLTYDSSIEELAEDSRKYHSLRDIEFVDEADDVTELDFGDMRRVVSGIPYLIGTKKEAEDVSRTINSAPSSGLTARTIVGSEGTEASFKALSGRNIRLIHVASHGFYLEANDRKTRMLTPLDGNDKLDFEDKSLMRSGLFFAGASNKYTGKKLPAGVDDGILTSHEISNMDLAGLELCVLSACQTAQGEINSEGVYGLQRGFKRAGAKSILMSLWSVDDDATCYLMTEFYRHMIVEKKSKAESLEFAKRAVRSQTSRGWDNPKYWAAFILLDAVD